MSVSLEKSVTIKTYIEERKNKEEIKNVYHVIKDINTNHSGVSLLNLTKDAHNPVRSALIRTTLKSKVKKVSLSSNIFIEDLTITKGENKINLNIRFNTGIKDNIKINLNQRKISSKEEINTLILNKFKDRLDKSLSLYNLNGKITSKTKKLENKTKNYTNYNKEFGFETKEIKNRMYPINKFERIQTQVQAQPGGLITEIEVKLIEKEEINKPFNKILNECYSKKYYKLPKWHYIDWMHDKANWNNIAQFYTERVEQVEQMEQMEQKGKIESIKTNRITEAIKYQTYLTIKHLWYKFGGFGLNTKELEKLKKDKIKFIKFIEAQGLKVAEIAERKQLEKELILCIKKEEVKKSIYTQNNKTNIKINKNKVYSVTMQPGYGYNMIPVLGKTEKLWTIPASISSKKAKKSIYTEVKQKMRKNYLNHPSVLVF